MFSLRYNPSVTLPRATSLYTREAFNERFTNASLGEAEPSKVFLSGGTLFKAGPAKIFVFKGTVTCRGRRRSQKRLPCVKGAVSEAD